MSHEEPLSQPTVRAMNQIVGPLTQRQLSQVYLYLLGCLGENDMATLHDFQTGADIARTLYPAEAGETFLIAH